jgi:thiamine monophosphate synthase
VAYRLRPSSLRPVVASRVTPWLTHRYGDEAAAATIQDLHLSGGKDEAAAAVPADLLRATSLIGPASYVAERLAAFRAAGVTTLQVRPLAHGTAQRLADLEKLKVMTS